MKKVVCISIFLSCILIGSLILFSAAAVKIYLDNTELADDVPVKKNNTLNVLEEEYHAIIIPINDHTLLKTNIVYFIFCFSLNETVFDLLIRPPIH